MSPWGEQVLSRAAGEVTGESLCWYSALPAFRILCFLYLICCYADIWHGFSGTHYSLLQELSFPVPYRRMTMAFMRIISLNVDLLFDHAASGYHHLCSWRLFCVRTLLFMFMFRADVSLGLESRILPHEFLYIRVVVLCRQFVRFLCVVSHSIFRV